MTTDGGFHGDSVGVCEREGGLTDGDFLFQLHDTSTKRTALKERVEKREHRGGEEGRAVRGQE